MPWGRGLEFDVAAADFELAGDQVDLVCGEHGRAAEGDGGGDLFGIENGDDAAGAGDDHPAWEGEDGLNRDVVSEELAEPRLEPAGLSEGLVEAVTVFAPRVGENLVIIDNLVFGETGARAAFAAGFGFDGEDAGGPDDDVVDVEGRLSVACGDVVEDAEAVGFQGIEGFTDDAFAEVAEVGVAPELDVFEQLTDDDEQAGE